MRTYATYADRLEWAMVCAGMDPKSDQSNLARKVGCRPQAIQHLLDPNKNAKSSRFTPQIAKALHCDVNWLASSQGPAPTLNKHKTSASDASISTPKVPVTKQLPTNGSHRITGNYPEPEGANVLPMPRKVPILSYEMAAQMTPLVDPNTLGEPLGTETIQKPLSLATFAVPIRDASMAPQFEPGREVVIIDPAWAPKPGKLVLARMRTGEVIFRKYREIGLNEAGVMVFELAPHNTDFATLHSERDGLTIIGVMAAYTHYEQED